MDEITRRFDRPHDHDEEALKAELQSITVPWRIYATMIGATSRQYHVEFRLTNGMTRAELNTALDKIS